MSFRRPSRPGIADVPSLDLGPRAAERASAEEYPLGDVREFPGPAHADRPAVSPLDSGRVRHPLPGPCSCPRG